jgi:small multidrug resistance pump
MQGIGNWVFLGFGIVFEVLGTICMKQAEGFTRLWPSVLVFIFYSLSLVSLIFVLKRMEVSIAYAIWASAGIVLIAILGMIFYKEPVSLAKIISIALIVAGIFGLELF